MGSPTQPPDDAEVELERIRRAYTRYSSDPAELGRRDPGNAGLTALLREWRGRLAERLGERGLPQPDSRVLDIGCGDGTLLAWFVDLGVEPSNCTGVDLMPERVERAASTLPEATFLCRDAASLPFGDRSFDVVCLSLVLSSIVDARLAQRICSEAARVLAEDGVLVWYDTRYPNPVNPDVRGVGQRAVKRLFPGFVVASESISLLPPVARRLTGSRVQLYPVLARFPPLRARYLCLLQRRPSLGTGAGDARR